jgi:hypothetical protein
MSVVVRYRLFPSGEVLQTVGNFASGAGTVGGAPNPLFLPSDPKNPKSPLRELHFLFWNLAGMTSSRNHDQTFVAPTGESDITAWYLEEADLASGSVRFQTKLGLAVLPDCPIETVVPAGAWTGEPSPFVSTTSAPGNVTITLKKHIASNASYFADFILTGSGAIDYGASSGGGGQLTALHGSTFNVIAQYYLPGGPPPEPCQAYSDNVAATSKKIADVKTVLSYPDLTVEMRKQAELLLVSLEATLAKDQTALKTCQAAHPTMVEAALGRSR